MKNEMIEIKYYKEAKDKFIGTKYLGIIVEYFAKIRHEGLDKTEILSSQSETSLEIDIEIIVKKLNLEWQISQYKQIDNLLIDCLKIPNQINWDNFAELNIFEESNTPSKSRKEDILIKEPASQEFLPIPEKPILNLPDEPLKEDYFSLVTNFSKIRESYELILSRYNIPANLKSQYDLAWEINNEIEKIPTSTKDYKHFVNNTIEEIFIETKQTAQKEFNLAIQTWNIQVEEINSNYDILLKKWELECFEVISFNKEIETQYQIDLNNYQAKINQNQLPIKKYLEGLKSYLKFDTNAVIEYSKLILNYSKYPEFVPKKFEVDYYPQTKILVVEYALPPIDTLPTLKEVKWIKNEIKEYHISETQLQKNFEKTMYNITLRSIYELFHTDEINALDAICFNGWVSSINKATGKRENNCILSIQTKKEEFYEINLSFVDPKVCFKSFKGVSSSKLSSITSIQPIIQINKNDRRFVESQNVTQNINESTNLAAMDWEEFEHLIREVFEKEFSYNGGEVKVTQASRDGGVDAIAFDPDPIRGGKIVIQAKRYTNTVGVSAVRDLFGTVMNEGANKGILVTTSDYGPDSYEFAKGKPLTLLNGGNLLYLLEKHGHNARINIEEARKLMKT